MRHIAIIGTGGIGQRHAQSCAALPATDYHLHLVEPNDANRLHTRRLLNGRDGVAWYKAGDELPKAIDVAIVATRADIRAAVTRQLVTDTFARSIILEKVLFQKLQDYELIGSFLADTGTLAWVNCPRRLWPAYAQLRDRLKEQRITEIEMSGADWDIGCNGIHFIDLFAFLTDASWLTVHGIELGDTQPAKRPGMLHIEGEVRGSLMQKERALRFSIQSNPAHFGPQTVRIKTEEGTIQVVENASSMTISLQNGSSISHAIPLQSQLTASTVEDIMLTGCCALTSYETSRALHEAFFSKLLVALEAADKLDDRAVCPVT